LIVLDPYSETDCRLLIRRNHSEETVEEHFVGDDYYLTEHRVFLGAVLMRLGSNSSVPQKDGVIESSYVDAFKTYELTWHVKTIAEKS
jgi:hypothetical protein